MGIYDREYYRDGGGNWGGWGSRGATPWLVGITVAAWVVQLVTRDAPGGGLTGWAWYDYNRVVGGEVWRLVTPIFLNDPRGLLSIIFNMIVLFFVGRALEERYGSREFVVFYVTSGVVSHLAFFAAQLAGLAPVGPEAVVLGSYPAVDAAFVVYAFLYPYNKILLFFVIPVPVWLVAVGFVFFNAIGVAAGVGVAFVALAGAVFGAAYYTGGVRLTGMFPTGGAGGWSRSRRQPRLRVVPPDDPDDGDDTDEPPPAPPPSEERFEDRVDRLLEKVSKYGQESLTPEERELLFRAGEHYKKRRR